MRKIFVRKMAFGGFIAGIGVAAIAVLGWSSITEARAGELQAAEPFVQTDARPIVCDGTELSIDPDDLDDDEAFLRERIELRPGLECQFRFFVTNPTEDGITIDRVTAPGLSGGAGLTAIAINPLIDGPMPLEPIIDLPDITWPIDDLVDPDSQQYYEIWLRFDPDSCVGNGGGTGLPRLEVYVDGDPEPITYLGPRVSTLGIGFNDGC